MEDGGHAPGLNSFALVYGRMFNNCSTFHLDNRGITLNSCDSDRHVGIIQNSKSFEALFNFSCHSINT